MYETFDHTADLGFRATAPDLDALFADMARCLFASVIENPDAIRPEVEQTIEIAGSDREAASWYTIFSANEMVVITAKGNPLGIKQVADLAKPGVKYVRVTGEKDLATGRPTACSSVRSTAAIGHTIPHRE